MPDECEPLPPRQEDGDRPAPAEKRNYGETPAHRELKRLALIWAQMNGFRIAATEVSLPNHRVRMDVAAYRAARVRVAAPAASSPTRRWVWKTTVGVTAIFECKACVSDFRRDAHGLKATLERLTVLHERRVRVEEELKIFYPSIRNGDALFAEYETFNFERPGYERYERIVREIRQLSGRLTANTKFDRLTQFGVANLFYLVAEPGCVPSTALPFGWGLLEREGAALMLRQKPLWHEVAEERRLAFLERIALAAMRSSNREHGITWETIDGARWAAGGGGEAKGERG